MAAAALDDQDVVGAEVGDAAVVERAHVRDPFAVMERQRADVVKNDGRRPTGGGRLKSLKPIRDG